MSCCLASSFPGGGLLASCCSVFPSSFMTSITSGLIRTAPEANPQEGRRLGGNRCRMAGWNADTRSGPNCTRSFKPPFLWPTG